MGSRILALSAGAGDEADKETFVSSLPNADQIRAFLNAPRSEDSLVHQFFYHSDPNVACYVMTMDGRSICLVVRGDVTYSQASAIEGRLDLLARISLPAFQDIVEDVLGKSVNQGEPKGKYLTHWFTGA